MCEEYCVLLCVFLLVRGRSVFTFLHNNTHTFVKQKHHVTHKSFVLNTVSTLCVLGLYVLCPPWSLDTGWCPQLQKAPLGCWEQGFNGHIRLWWHSTIALHTVEKHISVALVAELNILASTCVGEYDCW